MRLRLVSRGFLPICRVVQESFGQNFPTPESQSVIEEVFFALFPLATVLPLPLPRPEDSAIDAGDVEDVVLADILELVDVIGLMVVAIISGSVVVTSLLEIVVSNATVVVTSVNMGVVTSVLDVLPFDLPRVS